MSTYKTTIQPIFDVEVTYTYCSGSQGARDSLGGKAGAGPPLEPDEPPSLEIEGVFLRRPPQPPLDITNRLDDSDIEALVEEIEADLAAQEPPDEPELPLNYETD